MEGIIRSFTGVQGVHNGADKWKKGCKPDRLQSLILCVEHIGIEPMTSWLPVKRSSQLS